MLSPSPQYARKPGKNTRAGVETGEMDFGALPAGGIANRPKNFKIVLMFTQYYVDQKENALLATVDDRATAELEGRFEQIPSGFRAVCDRLQCFLDGDGIAFTFGFF